MTAPKSDQGDASWEERLVHSAQHYVPAAWRINPRETLHSARRYSAFVRVMKRLLPLAALSLVLAVLAYALQPRESGRLALTFEQVGTIKNDLAMLHPRLTGTDDDGLPFVVTAASAVQDKSSPNTVQLNDVHAEIALKDGTVLHVSASKGVVDTKTHRLDISGGIHFSSLNGYAAQTAAATADLKTGYVHGDTPVTADSAFGHLTAQSFALNKQTKQLTFTGQVHMVLYGAKK